MTKGLRLAETLAAYLCHEMAGPLSTLAAVLDLGGEDGEALALANAAMQRVRFLRAAWAGGAGKLDAAGFAKLAAGLPGGDRCRVDAAGIEGVLPDSVARIALCLLPVAVAALPRGGTIRVAGRVTLEVDGPQASWPAALRQCLTSADTAWSLTEDPRALPAPLATLLAGGDLVGITVESDSRITLRAMDDAGTRP